MEHDKKTIQILTDFVEGKITVEDFWKEFKASEDIRNILINNEIKKRDGDGWWCSANTLINSIKNISSYYYSSMLHICVSFYFESNNIPIKFDRFYENRYKFFLDIQPSWLDVSPNEENFLIENIINKIPTDLKTKTEKIKWCKEKIKELFKYDKTPPRWVQYAAWPIVNGKPLVFRKQSKEILD
ncbi:MAG: hypothetical protein LBN07_05275, partial [Christensenellaceae bacterium]|nr:hypothetical protein [Christensenellaceae bacterium]